GLQDFNLPAHFSSVGFRVNGHDPTGYASSWKPRSVDGFKRPCGGVRDNARSRLPCASLVFFNRCKISGIHSGRSTWDWLILDNPALLVTNSAIPRWNGSGVHVRL